MLVKKEDLGAAGSGGLSGRRGVQVVASILAADFSDLGRSVDAAISAGVDGLHVDVMDGRFVPNITVGPVVISALRRRVALQLDVHMMVQEPDLHVDSILEAGADMVVVHVESKVHLGRFVQKVRNSGKRVGVSLVPSSPHDLLEYVLHDVDFVLVMSVDPGFSGQQFMPSQLKKIERVRDMVEKRSLDVRVGVDGGITLRNAGDVVAAGAEVLVVGSTIFHSRDMCSVVRELKSL